MDQGNQLLTPALGVIPPCAVAEVRLTVNEKLLGLCLKVPRGRRFPCLICSQDCPVQDTQEKAGWHFNFFRHVACLYTRVPQVKCLKHGVYGVYLLPVPLVREGLGFRLLFEASVMAMVGEIPVLTVAPLI